MKVLVATEAFPPLSAHEVSGALGAAWAERGAAVAVVPMAAAGAGLSDVVASWWRAEPEIVGTGLGPVSVVRDDDAALISVNLSPAHGLDPHSSSAELGRTVVEVLSGTQPSTAVLEVVGGDWHDGGRGFLEAFGGLETAREYWCETQLHLVVAASEASVPLTGLRGITSRQGRGSDDAPSVDIATLVRVDQTLVEWAQTLGVDPTRAGAGAAGGLGTAVLSLGGAVFTGPQIIADHTRLEASIAACDLVVTGSAQLDFGSMGGEVLADLIERTQRHLVPLISVSGRNHISPRELRSIGVEAAYSVRDDTDIDAEHRTITVGDICAAANRVAQTWTW